MNSTFFNTRFIAVTGLILIAATTRFIPHPPNLTAVSAIALFGGAYFTKRYLAFIVPISAMLLTDLFIGFHSAIWAVYLSFILIVAIGFTLKQKKNLPRILGASLSASISFFIITNFGTWLSTPLYPKTLEGLAICYTAAIPFFHYTVIGDLFFVGALFGFFELAKMKYPSLAEAKI